MWLRCFEPGRIVYPTKPKTVPTIMPIVGKGRVGVSGSIIWH